VSSFPQPFAASDFFLTAVSTDHKDTDTGDTESALQVIGFVCGTLSTSNTLSHDSMSFHEPQGKLLCIHSVCVAEEQRRKGLGSRLMLAYVNFVKQGRPDVETMRLICKEHLVS
jgi:ribosomal protein S18 acetylase RimI-like enzyme